MKEKELRIALVCFGGVSLAVYMHGVTKELWKLAKASQIQHADDPAQAAAPVPPDTEGVYLEMLRRVGQEIALRVVIDVVAGSSAGAINGVLLARGLAHDLPLDALTDLWLENADVTRLMAPAQQATTWSKWFLRPFLWAGMNGIKGLAPDEEARDKLSLFVRSRWFQPPFDGDRLMNMLLDAAYAMDAAAKPGASLLPTGLPLSLHVTVTDFHGYRQCIAAHDPPVIEEREHRHVLGFRYWRGADGTVVTDFDRDSVPGLAFAARATSSFPGAFAPAQLKQMDRIMADRGQAWPMRARFIAKNFAKHMEAGLEPGDVSFIDGSVLNNKPFAEALTSIANRPAYREVDRRLVYIDPKPERLIVQREAAPGFFRTLKGALSDIPRNEPVRDELADIARRNTQVERLRAVQEAARPRVRRMVREVVGGELPDVCTDRQMRRWREDVSDRAARAAGFAYEAYLRLKIEGVLDRLAGLMAELTGMAPDGPPMQRLCMALRDWARLRGVLPEILDAEAAGNDGPPPPWVGFLRDFDAGFRARRLRFVVRELNRLYGEAGKGAFSDTDPRDLDKVKVVFHAELETLRAVQAGTCLTPEERNEVAEILGGSTTSPDPDTIDRVLDCLSRRFELEKLSRRLDGIFARMGLNCIGTAARRELGLAYLGYAFWDVLTFSTSGWRDLMDEFHAIKVDRIGPPDAKLLRSAGAPLEMRGMRLNSFGAFFSRRDREQDYLLGRLHAVERVVDLVADAALPAAHLTQAEIDGFKLRAFRAVLEAERGRLGDACPAILQAEAWLEKAGALRA